MKYRCETIIDLPRDRVVAVFGDPATLPRWQDGLKAHAPLEGEPGTMGARSRLEYRMGRRDVEMTETIVARDLPEVLSATYETGQVWNLVQNRFEALADGRTRWTIDTEFRCRGPLRVLTWVAPGLFRRQTRRMMADFKTFAESQGPAA